MVEFAEDIAFAQEDIETFGREVTFIAFDTTPQSSSQPWKGPANPRTTPSASQTSSAVFVEPSSAVRLGMSVEASDLLKNSEQILMVSLGATVDPRIYDEVIDGSTRWKIVGLEVLRPNEEYVLAFIGVAR